MGKNTRPDRIHRPLYTETETKWRPAGIIPAIRSAFQRESPKRSAQTTQVNEPPPLTTVFREAGEKGRKKKATDTDQPKPEPKPSWAKNRSGKDGARHLHSAHKADRQARAARDAERAEEPSRPKAPERSDEKPRQAQQPTKPMPETLRWQFGEKSFDVAVKSEPGVSREHVHDHRQGPQAPSPGRGR